MLSFDLKALNMPDIERRLTRLPDKMSRLFVRRAMRNSAKRLKKELLKAIGGAILRVRTGRTRAAFAASPIRTFTRRKGGTMTVRIGQILPPRALLNIPPESRYYYPAALEYGTRHMAAKAPIRRTVNRMERAEIETIGDELARVITQNWQRN